MLLDSVMLGSGAIDSRTLLEQLKEAFSQTYQPSDVRLVNEKLEEVTRRLSELETSRPEKNPLRILHDNQNKVTKDAACTNMVSTTRESSTFETAIRIIFTMRIEDVPTTSLLGGKD